MGLFKSRVTSAFVALYLILSSVAHAETAQPTYSTAQVIRQVIAEITRSVSDGFTGLNSGMFDTAGQSILWMLILILMVWSAIKSYFGPGFNSFIEDSIVLFLQVGIIQLFLWSGGIAAIEAFINSIATAIAGADLSSLPETVGGTLQKTFESVFKILTMPSIETKVGFSLEKLLVALPQLILQYFAKFISAALVLLGALVYIANVILAYGSIVIAKSLAPVLIPWILVQQTSFLFDGWLRFFIGACLFKVVGAFFIKLTSNWIDSITLISERVKLSADTDPYTLFAGNLIVYVAIIFLAGAAAYLMTMVPSLASGLISGSTMGAGFKGMGALTGGLGGKMIGAATRGQSNAGKAGFVKGVQLAQKLMK